MKLKLLVAALTMLLLVSAVSAKTLDEHVDELLEKDGSKLPGGISAIISEGVIHGYIFSAEQYSYTAAYYLDTEEQFSYVHAITAKIGAKHIASIERGVSDAPDILVIAREDAALRVFEADNEIEQLGTEMQQGNIGYVVEDGWTRFKLGFIKAIAKFLALFSSDIRALLPLLG